MIPALLVLHYCHSCNDDHHHYDDVLVLLLRRRLLLSRDCVSQLSGASHWKKGRLTQFTGSRSLEVGLLGLLGSSTHPYKHLQ